MLAAFLTVVAVQHEWSPREASEIALPASLGASMAAPRETYFLVGSAVEAADVQARLVSADPVQVRPWYVVDVSTGEGSRLAEVLVDSVTWGDDSIKLIDLRTGSLREGDAKRD
jgi:hypothetical protein